MPISEAQKRARNKYDSEHYTMIGCKVKKEYAAQIRDAAAAAGTTPAAIIRAALDAFIQSRQDPPSSIAGEANINRD